MVTTTKIECPKCCGRRHMEEVSHIASGVCFRCGGAGVVEIRYTEQQAAEIADQRALTERKLTWLRNASVDTLRRLPFVKLNAAFQFAAAGVSCSEPTQENMAIYNKIKRVWDAAN